MPSSERSLPIREIREIIAEARRRLRVDPPHEFREVAHERYYEDGIADALHAIESRIPHV